MADEFTERVWVYAGQRVLRGGGLGGLWIDHRGEERVFKTKCSVVGGRYRVECTDDGNHIRGKPVFHGSDGDGSAKVAQWQLEDREARAADQLRKSEAKAAKKDVLGELTLNQVRAMLSKRFGPNHTVLLAQILQYIQS